MRRREDQPLIISIGFEGNLKIWDASTLTLLKKFEEVNRYYDVVYVGFFDWLVVGGEKGIGCWSLNGFEKIKEIGHLGAVNRVCFDSNVRKLYFAQKE